MDKKKLFLQYIEEVFMIFGIMIMIMNVLCFIFGESAKGISQLFIFGNKGLSTSIMLQFFCIALISVILDYIFLTDKLIKNMSLLLRIICMMSFFLMIIISFIILFEWFPINMWEPWLLFGISFGISFLIGCVVNVRKERLENEKMARALEELKRSVDNEESNRNDRC